MKLTSRIALSSVFDLPRLWRRCPVYTFELGTAGMANFDEFRRLILKAQLVDATEFKTQWQPFFSENVRGWNGASNKKQKKLPGKRVCAISCIIYAWTPWAWID